MRRHTGLKIFVLAAAICALFVLMVSVSGANVTSNDPLISLSYLTGSFRTQMLDEMKQIVREETAAVTERFSERISAMKAALSSQVDTTSTHSSVTVPSGSSYLIPSGAEFLLLSGDLSTLGTGLTDTTLGTAVGERAVLSVNHLFVAGGPVTVQATTEARILLRK